MLTLMNSDDDSTIGELGQALEEKTSQNALERLAFTREDQQDVSRIVQEINFAIEFAMVR